MRISPLFKTAVVFAATLVASGDLCAKEIRENPVQKKLERYLPYSIDEIEASAASINFNPRLVAEELGQKLDQFYLSDPSEKKIANRQDNDSNAAWFVRVAANPAVLFQMFQQIQNHVLIEVTTHRNFLKRGGIPLPLNCGINELIYKFLFPIGHTLVPLVM